MSHTLALAMTNEASQETEMYACSSSSLLKAEAKVLHLSPTASFTTEDHQALDWHWMQPKKLKICRYLVGSK